MRRFDITALPLLGLQRLARKRQGDDRGFLARLFCAQELAGAGWTQAIAQINHTHTAVRGTVRGMHYQNPPFAESKLISCLQGSIWDVAVDVRAGSPTFLHWHAETLSADNGFAMLIPQGFAHGFQTLTDDVELLYCHSAPYAPQYEAALNALDDSLAIAWPLPVLERSARDQSHPAVTPEFKGVVL
jgi:dTDP-4-dehydrorhamnose 3,5-epimerase